MYADTQISFFLDDLLFKEDKKLVFKLQVWTQGMRIQHRWEMEARVVRVGRRVIGEPIVFGLFLDESGVWDPDFVTAAK